MPTSGLNRMAAADLTLKKKKGKELVKAVGEAFAPEHTLELNRKVGAGEPSAGLKVGDTNTK